MPRLLNIFIKRGLLLAVLLGLLIVLSAESAALAPPVSIPPTDLVLRLASAPFPDPNRDEGIVLGGKDFSRDDHYSDSSVRVFVPADAAFQPTVNLVFFFHGWYSSVDDCVKQFGLDEQFNALGSDAILVIPETAQEAPDSFGGKFEDVRGFRRFVVELLDQLEVKGLVSSTQIGKVVLSGHSGAYRVIAAILDRGGVPIQSVVLFDALYGRLSSYEAWLDRRGGYLFSVFTKDSDTESLNDLLIEKLTAKGVPFVLSPEAEESLPAAKNVRAHFYRSNRDHYGVVSDNHQWATLIQKALQIE